MRAVIVFESMYGNTHHVATAISTGLGPETDVIVVPVEQATRDLIASADLLVVGGPTHVHGLSRPMTRAAAVEATDKPGNSLELEPNAEGAGLREWFDRIGRIELPAAAFDTRASGPAVLTGRASKGIARRLHDAGASLIVPPESFLVTKENHLVDDEERRARGWGEDLVRAETVLRSAGSAS